MNVGIRRRPFCVCAVLATVASMNVFGVVSTASAQSAPSTYSAYSGTDVRVPPAAPALGPANSVITDPTFGSRILRVTDGNTMGGKSLIPSDSGFTRTFNANSTAIKLIDEQNWSYWVEFNGGGFNVGNGSSNPGVHALTSFDARWEWSAVNPDVMYVLRSSTIAKYNKATGALTDLGGPSNGDPVAYHAAVVGADAWVCS